MARFPGLQVVGCYTPPFRALNPDEVSALQKQIREARPDIMWVGLSTPKQEKFMAEYLPLLDVTLMVGVGAAFDFHSGRVKQAPRWMQRSGLEWFFRLCSEPRRLAKRYFRNNPRFVWKIAGQISGVKKYALD
jgi:N-acetylglucosaminyldiphosphoundecaprenol N-acetyl-beta-D-mannosaminyltransferase